MLRPCWRSWPWTSRSARLPRRSGQPSGCRSARRKVRAAVVLVPPGCVLAVWWTVPYPSLRLHASLAQRLTHGCAATGKGKDRLPGGKEDGPDGKGHLPHGQQSSKQARAAQAITADCSGQQAAQCTSSGGSGALLTLSEQASACRARVQVSACAWDCSWMNGAPL